jgi:hypothetical protein
MPESKFKKYRNLFSELGKIGRGKSKVRGSSAHYRKLQELSAAKRRGTGKS